MKLGEKGYTFVELLVVITILVFVANGAMISTFYVLGNTERDRNQMTAVSQLENAGYWINLDAQRAQTVEAEGLGGSGTDLTVSWAQHEDGTLSADDYLYFAFSGDGGNTWSSNIVAFSGDIGTTPQPFSYIIPSQYLTQYFKMRFLVDSDPSESVFIDNIAIISQGIFSDDCSSFDNWNSGVNWDISDGEFRGEGAGGVSWYNEDWQYRKKITIDHTKIDADLTGFPVLISITDSNLRDHAKSDGSDILFTSSSGTTKLKREIERYTSSSGTLVAWVKADLSSTSDTEIYLYYGNPAASETNDTATWDANFNGVWHLAETSGEQTTILRPNAAGDETSITYQEPSSGAHWDKVDEGTADDFSTYVYTTDTPTPPSDWYNLSWQYRKKITIDHTKVDADLTDFPVLISITDSNLRDHAKSDGSDIVFTSSDGMTKLKREIERYTSSSGTLVAWVKANLANTSNTVIYLYYGNPAASETNDTATWDTSFKGVWHLNQTTGGTNAIKDSTSNNNHGTDQGSPTLGATGEIGNAISLDGSNDYIYTTNSFANPQQFTIEAWFKTSTASGKKLAGFENAQSGQSASSWDRQIYVGTDGKLRFGCYSGTTDTAVSTATYTDGAWHHAVGVRNNTTDRLYLYIDGNEVNNVANANAQSYTGYLRMGSYKTTGWTSGVDGYFPGFVDEARLSLSVRSAGWIKTSYNNQSAPGSFYSVEAEEIPTGGYERDLYDVTDYSAEAAITGVTVYFRFSGDQVGGNNYPGYARAAIKTKSTVYRGSVESQTGKTFVTKSSTWTTNPYTGSPWIWSEIAALQAGIELAGTSTTQAYCTQVYVEVTYNTGSASAVKDSTSNANHGTPYGSMTSGDQVTGKIDGSLDFDGSDDYISMGNILTFTSSQSLMISGWFKADSFALYNPILERTNRGTRTDYGMLVKNSTTVSYHYDSDATDDVFIDWTVSAMSTGQWHYLAMNIYNNSTVRAYFDGQSLSNLAGLHGNYVSTGFYVGTGDNGGTARYFDGILDEVRISNTNRSASWIKTSYNNQSAPGSFYSVGTEELEETYNPSDRYLTMSTSLDLSSCPASEEVSWSDELLINPGFEDGNFNGWTTYGSYWEAGSTDPEGSAGPHMGSYCAFQNAGDTSAYIQQDADVSAYATQIDEGSALCRAGGWAVSSEYSYDDYKIIIQYLDSGKGVISTALDTGWLSLQSNWTEHNIEDDVIPANTRYIRAWAATIEDNTYASGSLDDFSVKVGVLTEGGEFPTAGFPLTFIWTTWDESGGTEYQAVYSIVNNQLTRSYSVAGGAPTEIYVAEYINPYGSNCEFASGRLTFTLTATVGGGPSEVSETRQFQVIHRPD